MLLAPKILKCIEYEAWYSTHGSIIFDLATISSKSGKGEKRLKIAS
jgi:hypothetical protein